MRAALHALGYLLWLTQNPPTYTGTAAAALTIYEGSDDERITN